MTIADTCPECGADAPFSDGHTEMTKSRDDSGIVWLDEAIYCACGTQVGGFAHPQNV